MTKEFKVSGMSCAACQNTVEKAVCKVAGVEKCSVSLLTSSMTVEGDAKDEDIISAVKKAGYGASLPGEGKVTEKEDDREANSEFEGMKKRFLYSLVFLLLLMYISMGHLMWSWPLPAILSSNPMAMALLELLLSTAILVINQKFFISGTKALLNRSPNMDTLVSLGSFASYAWSIVEMFKMTAGDHMASHMLLHGLYFESAAMILALITLGKMLEARSKGKTTSLLKALMSLSPETAIVIRDGKEVEVKTADIRTGETFILRPGSRVPVDGIIEEGNGAFDESTLTGESLPVDKGRGDKVFSSTINVSGSLKCSALKVGKDTVINKIIEKVRIASSSKAPIAKVADKVSGIFVPVVLVIAAVTTVVWYLVTRDLGYSLERGISVLVISCPCALGLATPVAIMVGSGKGAEYGILYKNAAALEEMGRTEVVVLDKTGTITEGKPDVDSILSEKEEELMEVAYSLEKESEHPVAKAIVKEGERRGLKALGVENFLSLPGMGVEGTIGSSKVWGGKMSFAETKAKLSDSFLSWSREKEGEGSTVLWFGKDNEVLGLVSISDRIREDSVNAIRELKNLGLRVVMLTGDNRGAAETVGKRVGVDEIYSSVLPEGKAEIIGEEKRKGKTIMVGDGVNDTVALKSADVGVAMGKGTDIALDSADVVLTHGRLTDLSAAIRLSRKTLKNIHENLYWAFIYNTLGIPLAAGVWIPLFGWKLTPMFGALAMSLSSFCVVSNALRLNGFNPRDNRHDRKRIKLFDKEKKVMTKTFTIEGMMCGHCEARVKKTILAYKGVKSAEVSHTLGRAVVEMENDCDIEGLKKAIEDQDYKVVSIN